MKKYFDVSSNPNDTKKKNETLLEKRPYSKESNNGDNMRIMWDPTGIAYTDKQEFSEVILDDLSEINKKIIRKDVRTD